MPNQQFNDQVLVQNYIKGDESSLAILLERHKRKVFSYIIVTVKNRELAQDIFQETFFKVVNTIKKGQYNEEGKFLPWVLRIAHNLMVDGFRDDKRMPRVKNTINSDGEEFDIFSIIPNEDKTAEEKIAQNNTRKDIRKLIEQLPKEQKEIVMMRYYYDMSFKEISEQTNIGLNTALGRMRYALINLRKMMEEKKLTYSF
jgi:RNA polymerase sigma-70 factor (ECF subfamily)